MYLQAIEAVHRKRTIAFCYCAVGSSLGIVEATDEYHVPVFAMATPTDNTDRASSAEWFSGRTGRGG